MKKVVITGAGGQLGKAFTKKLQSIGIECLPLTRKELDITDLHQLKEFFLNFRPQYIINCAAYNEVDKAEEEKEKALLVNGIALRYMGNLAAQYQTTVIHYSTDYVFNGEKEEPYLISDQPKPINHYGQTKLLGEKEILTHNPKTYVIRVSWVFGNGEQNFIYKLLNWASKNEKLRIVTDQISSPTYTEEIVKITLDLIKTEQYGLYHLSGEGQASRYDWAKFILDYLNWQGELIPAASQDFPTRAKRPRYSKLRNFPLKNLLGYLPETWQESTEKYIRTIREKT